jgi:hypothetical protein
VPSECKLTSITSDRVIGRRVLLASAAVAKLLQDSGEAAQAGFPDGHAWALISRYLAGNSITMSLRARSRSYVEFERLANHDEVWVISFRNASQTQWRFFGRFAAPDHFVALLPRERGELRGRNYDRAAEDFIAHWNRCFSQTPVVRGEHWSDYVTGPARDICDDGQDAF